MSQTTLQLGFVPKERGEYTSGVTYYKDNVVQYNGSSYIADPVGWSELHPTDTYVTIAPTDASGNLNAGWRVFASGNNKFTTGESVDNIGIDNEPTAGSDNLVKSGGIYKKNNQLDQKKVDIKVGKNLFDKTKVYANHYITSSGDISLSNNYSISDYIEVSPQENYYLSASSLPAGSNSTYIVFFDENKLQIPSSIVSANTKLLTAPVDSKYVRLTVLNDRIDDVQLEKGSAQTEFAPYSEIGGYPLIIPSSTIKNNHIADKAINRAKLYPIDAAILTNSSKNCGFEISGTTVSTYANLTPNDFVTIPIGTKLENNGSIRLILGSDSSLTNRYDIDAGSTWITTFEVNHIKSANVTGNYSLKSYGILYKIGEVNDNAVTTEKIANNAVTTEKIANKTIQLNDLEFTESINLIDPNDINYKMGKYLSDNTGSLSNNSVYDTSGFIPITPGLKYSTCEGLSYFRFVLQYDNNKNPISSSYVTNNTYSFLAVEGAAYVRVTMINSTDIYCAQSNVRLPYTPYKLKIKGEVINFPETNVSKPQFFLPKHIYVGVGRTIEIYWSQVCLNYEKYNIRATCSIGKSLERKFQIIGDSTHVGNYTLTVYVYDDEMNLLEQGSSTIHIVADNVSSTKQILPIGDSLTNQKPWMTEITTLNNNMIFVGTRGNSSYSHEGRSGATVSTYTNVTGAIVYDFDGSYKGTGYGTAPDFDETASYNVGDIVKIAHSYQAGSGYRYWVFKTSHSPGPFNSEECWSCSDGNPFYNYQTGQFSMSFYKSFFNMSYDCIIIYLGTNGINLTPDTNPNGALGLKNLVDLIRQDEPTVPIVIVNTIFRSNQNGIGNQGNTDGYSAQAEYKFNADRKVLLLAKSVDEMLGNYSNVFLCPVGFTHDSKYNFGNVKTQVNPRITSIENVYELFPSDSVHPQTSGYYQMADEIYSVLCAAF